MMHLDFAAGRSRKLYGALDNLWLGRRRGFCRTPDADVHSHHGTADHQRMGNVVVAVAQIGQFEPLQRALLFPNRLQIGQDLARMGHVGQRVNHRHRGVTRHLFKIAVLE